MSRHSNVEIMQKTYRALIDGDRDALEQLVSPDARIHITGRNALAGDYEGPDAMLFFFRRLVTLTDSTYHRELLDMLGGDTHAAAFLHVTGQHGARRLDMRMVFMMEIADGRVIDLRGYYSDQDAWDKFWADEMLSGSPLPDFQPPRRPIEP